MVKLIVWDLDGTLVNSLPATIEAFNDAIEPFEKRRLPIPELISHFGLGEREILSRIVGESDAQASYDIFLPSLKKRLLEVVIFDGILETLTQLSTQSLLHAVFTGRGRQGTDIILNHLDLNPFFECVITRDEVINHKPHPEGLLKICEKLKVEAHQAIMIGDFPVDIQAGKAAGAKTIGCVWGSMRNRDLIQGSDPSYIAEHPSELIDWIESNSSPSS